MSGYRKLGRKTAHRKTMLRNLVTDLFREERISTTEHRAKEARKKAEKIITLAKKNTIHARRQILSYIYDEDVVYTIDRKRLLYARCGFTANEYVVP
ncbi:MAG: 50S ribosomal protein L17, partial [Firmicutes bacterium]|nr:50S ribosomal protein L17 [Bacillota bacterium]